MNRFGSPEDCVWVETDPGYSYHVMNAWDDPDNQHQVMQYCAHALMKTMILFDRWHQSWPKVS